LAFNPCIPFKTRKKLLSLKHVVDGFNVANLTTIITQAIIVNGGISNLDFISKKLMSFGANGVIVF
jgi:hypothetical protein